MAWTDVAIGDVKTAPICQDEGDGAEHDDPRVQHVHPVGRRALHIHVAPRRCG